MTGKYCPPFSPKAKSKTRSDGTEQLFVRTSVFLPVTTLAILRDHSRARGLPMARLIAMAVDNELDMVPPFNYPCDLPTSDYQVHLHAREAGLIMNYLAKFKKGASLDQLMLARRDIGIENRSQFLFAMRELIETGMVESFTPTYNKFDRFSVDYTCYRLAPDALAHIKRDGRGR